MQKTKRFVVLLLVLCLMVSCLPVGAFDFEMPETAGEMPETNLVSSALNADIDIPTEDETLGTLVWYNNFDETDAASATYSVGAYTAGAYQEGGVAKSTLEIADNPDTEKTGKALKITQTAAHGGYQVTFTDKLATPGVYTLLVDIYVPEDGTASGFWTHFVADRYNGTSTDPNEWNGGAYVKGTGAWYTYQETFQLPGNNLTEESLKAYTQYILHKGSSNQVYYIDNVRIYCNAYKSAARPAAYDKTYGQLIYFDNFSGKTGFINLADIKLADYAHAEKKTFDGFTTLKCGQSKLSPEPVGIEVTPADGTNWVYADGTPMTGEISLYVELYVDYDTLPSGRFTVGAPGNIWGAYYTDWKVDKNTLSARTWGMVQSQPLSLADYTNIGILSNNWRTEYCRAIGVYLRPTNALWLVDAEGGNRTFEVVSAETYTFPAAFNGVNVRTWKNGDTTYKAGEAVALADVAGKTWTVGATTDVAFADAVSVRTSGTPGIRFKATLDLATRADENFAEIGFMATRDTHYTNAFDASADSFILANANAANAKLCTVVRKSGSDLNRYLTEGDGELNFNALVVGVPENAAYLTENLHLRAFVVCGGVTYYSAVKTDSVYGAVKRVSADPNYENDPYIQRIIELCETTNG